MRSPFSALRRLLPDRGPTLAQARLAQAKVRLAELQGKKSVTATGDRGWHSISAGYSLASDGSFDSMSTAQLAQQYSKHSLVRACIDEVAKSVQDGTLQVGRDTENGFEPEDVSELLDPLYNDPEYSFGDIWTLMVSRLMSTGAAFAVLGQYQKIMGVGEFTPVPTSQMRLYSDGIRVTRYEYYPEQRDPKSLKREEVCGLWFPDPARQIGWVSPLGAAARAYQIDEQRESLTHETLKNRVIPGAVISSMPGPNGRNLTADQARELKGKVDAACGTDASRRGSLLVLPNGLQFGKGQDLEDIDFAVLNALTETRICMAFGVPPIIVAAKSGLDASTYANYKEARRAFYVETIRPLWSFLAAGLTRAMILNQGLDRSLYYQWDYSKVAELQRDQSQAMTRATQGYTGQILTLNEARKEAGYPPVDGEGGDMRYAPPAPASSLFGGLGGDGTAQGKRKAPAICDCHAKAGAVGPLPEFSRIRDAMVAHFKRQHAEALEAVTLRGERVSFDIDAENDKLRATLTPVLADIYEDRGKALLERVGQRVNGGAGQKRLRGKVAFEPDRSFAVYRSSVNDLISRQLKKLVMEINGTTKVDLELAIDKAVSEAGARQETPDLRAVVDDVFATATESRSRAIAQTESSRAIHDSTVMAAESSGVVKGFKPIISADACEVCMSHEGEFTPLDAAKRQIGEYEGRGLPPWHPHDRCTVEEIIDEEAY